MTLGGAQSFELLLDTGSTTLGVASAGCSACTAAGVSSLYQPGASAVDEHATADAGYGALGTSGWSGEIYEDWVGTQGAPDMARVKLGAITEESQFLVGTCGGGPPGGVIGFAWGADALPGTDGFFDQVVAAGALPDVFATRFCPTEGTLWLGGYDPAFTTASPQFTPMTLTGGAFTTGLGVYVVDLVSITVLGTTVPIASASFPGTMLDTGASVGSLPPDALSALTSAIASSPAFAQVFGSAASSFFTSTANHVALAQTKARLDAALPPVTLTFGASNPISVQAVATEGYLVSNVPGEWSPSFAPRAPDDATYPGIAAILGPPILRSSIVIFDRAGKRIGFAPHAACP
ncbi:MAG TPA: pepsin-like aspartic protease [Polyangiaceae bacterium]